MKSIKKHIVSIDDDGGILTLIHTVLSEDFQVTTFNDTHQALEALPELKPDLIISDINMPGLDGFEIHQAVREIPSLRSVPFIYLTGLSDRAYFRKGMNQGADDYLTKPFTPDELREVVAIRLQRTESLRENDWEILSLGGVAVIVAGQVLEYEAKKVIELFLYLMTKDEPIHWRELFADLWWDVVNDNAVHVLVGRARKAFEGLTEFIIEGDLLKLRLLKPCTWDARVFEKEANTALSGNEFNLVERAIRLYKGPFLKDFDSPWSNDQRSHYETLYTKLLELSVSLAPTDAQKQTAQKRLESFWEAI